jgi:hypothetical protein
MIQRLFHSIKQRLAGWLIQLAVRLSPPPPGVAESPPSASDQGPHLDNLDPFEGTAQEAAIKMEQPAILKINLSAITQLKKDSPIPQAIEEIRLTKYGKALTRKEFLVLDGLNSIGRLEDLKGVCTICGKFVFTGMACQACSAFCCPACAQPLNATPGAPRLCPTCTRKARWQHDNWANGTS